MHLKLLALLLPLAALLALSRATADTAPKDDRVYELRVYYANQGKLDDLHARFRNHTCKLFEKHGMTNIGYWVPTENPDNQLIYIVAHPSRAAADKAWAAFRADPAWDKAKKDSEVNGPLVSKADVLFLSATDYSAAIKPAKTGERVFELRTYIASPNNLEHLHSRFRHHTCKLFEKHGMTNLGYWVPMKDQKGASDTLIYILAHKSPEAAKASFAAFGKDPAWSAAMKASEEKAGGALTTQGGVKSVFLKATDYSPMQ